LAIVLFSTTTRLGARGGASTTNATRYDLATPAVVDITRPRG